MFVVVSLLCSIVRGFINIIVIVCKVDNLDCNSVIGVFVIVFRIFFVSDVVWCKDDNGVVSKFVVLFDEVSLCCSIVSGVLVSQDNVLLVCVIVVVMEGNVFMFSIENFRWMIVSGFSIVVSVIVKVLRFMVIVVIIVVIFISVFVSFGLVLI